MKLELFNSIHSFGIIILLHFRYLSLVMQITDILEQVKNALIDRSNEKTRQSALRFFKEPILAYGVKTPDIHAISKEIIRGIKDENKANIFSLCEILFQTGYIEEAIIAIDIAYSVRKKFKPEDFEIFQKWISLYITNWATCDGFSNHTIGTFLVMYPSFIDQLKTWAVSPSRWMRRAAAVSLIVPAKQGYFLAQVFELATILMEDHDDLVQKGYGWLLKCATQKHEQEVFEFVMKNKTKMPRTALRYAIEKMPVSFKKEAMDKNK